MSEAEMTGDEQDRPGPATPLHDYLTVDEAAEVMRIKRRKMKYLIAQKRIPSVKLDDRRLLRRVDIDAFMAAHLTAKLGGDA